MTRAPDGQPAGSPLVGVLGGMGPRATVDFYDKLVTLSDARTDQEHVRAVIWADPTVPSRQAALLDEGTDPTPWLRRGIDALVASGAEIIVVPCNTVHHYLPGLVPGTVELIDIVETTVAALGARTSGGTTATPTPVGLLATDALLASGLYQRALDHAGLRVALPDPTGLAGLTALVEAVKGGAHPSSLLPRLEEIVAPLRAQGATTVVSACTELSSILDETSTVGGCELVDPSRELALATIRRSRDLSGASSPPTGNG